MAPGILTNGWNGDVSVRTKASRKSFSYESLRFDPKLQPKKYEIAGMRTLLQSDAFLIHQRNATIIQGPLSGCEYVGAK